MIPTSRKNSSSILSFASVCSQPSNTYQFRLTYVYSEAKEERKLYTLDPISDVAATPPPVPGVITPSLSNPPPASCTTGPVRTRRTTTQARMQTGPVPPALRPRVSKNIPSKIPAAKKNRANGTRSEANESQAVATQITIQPIAAEFVEPTQPTQPTLNNGTPDEQQPPPDSQLPEDVPDDASHTSTHPDVSDVDMDDSAPPAVVDDDEGDTTAPTVPSDLIIQVKINPALGIPVLIETPPPVLLFEDTDVRPEWLIRSIKDCLQYAPYYMCLSKVVDLFLTQEARLGYPPKVNGFCRPPHT